MDQGKTNSPKVLRTYLVFIVALIALPVPAFADPEDSIGPASLAPAEIGSPLLPCNVAGLTGAGIDFPPGEWSEYAPWVLIDHTAPDVGVKIYLPLPPTTQFGQVLEIHGLVCGVIGSIEELVAIFTERTQKCADMIGRLPQELLECVADGDPVSS